MSSIECFTSNAELRSAVLAYVQPGVSSDPNSEVAIKYGYPIDNWCVSAITDFSRIFIPPEEDNVGTLFDENIAGWDVSNGINFSSMFEGAFAFDQDISSWNVSNAISMDRMFNQAFAFNRDLCPWGVLLKSKGATAVNVTEAFLDTSCPMLIDPVLNTASGVFGPFCYNCLGGQDEITSTPTNSPSEEVDAEPTLSPTHNPTDSPTIVSPSSVSCFQNKVELELALAEYLSDNSMDTDVAEKYGWPINNWCVSDVTDFSRLFSPINNLDKSIFNEDISGWDVSNAITMESMFERNTFFNQDISSWELGLKIQNTARMFFGSTSFNQSLCLWGDNINVLVNTTQMFRGTSCPSLVDPSFENESKPGPFCYVCDSVGGIPTTESPMVSPTEPPIFLTTDSPVTTPTEAPAVSVLTSSPTTIISAPIPTQQPMDPPPEPGSVNSDEPTFTFSGQSLEPTPAPFSDRDQSSSRMKKYSILLGFVVALVTSLAFC